MLRIFQHTATATGIAVAALIIALVNPHTGFRELKHSWAVRHDGLIFGSGWYELQRPSIVEFVRAP